MFLYRVKTYSFISLWTVGLMLIAACSAKKTSDIPEGFLFVMDVRTAEKGSPNYINIKINAKGQGSFEEYDTHGTIQYDLNDMVTYGANQIVRKGKLKLTEAQLKQLWDAINENKFFELNENYQMEIGFSYAFIMVEADGNKHIVDNIGMEVPSIRTIVETVDTMMPKGVDLDYGETYELQK